VTPKTTAIPATATPKAPPAPGARGGGGFGGLGLALALLLAGGLLAGTASLIALSFRQRA
jgi:predicted lipid-binding transport protein (Tim44 family)